ncbi:MAG: hypothetical protein M3Y83_14470 [Actinomycetota bacterium]|nr:hypothetical protein [Actinomycetota bacterium]
MANPAELLHQTLIRWRANGGSYVDQLEQRIAVRHLDAIDELLTQMDAAQIGTDVYRRYFDKWATLTLHHPHDWQSQGQRQHIDDTPLDHLQNLSAWFRTLVPTVQAGGLDSLREFADGAEAVLADDDSIDPLLKRHVQSVIEHLAWCIDRYDEVGDFELREAVDRLIAAMVTTAARSKKKDGWRDWMNTFVYPFSVNMVSAIPAQAVVQLALGG